MVPNEGELLTENLVLLHHLARVTLWTSHGEGVSDHFLWNVNAEDLVQVSLGSRQFGAARHAEGAHRNQDPDLPGDKWEFPELSQADIYSSGTATIARIGEQRPG